MTNLEKILLLEINQQFALWQNISEYKNLDNYPEKNIRLTYKNKYIRE